MCMTSTPRVNTPESLASDPPACSHPSADGCTVSSRGRKPTVGVRRKGCPTRQPTGCPWQFGPFRAGCRLMRSCPWVSSRACGTTQSAPLTGSKARDGKLDASAPSLPIPKTGISILRISGGSKYTPGGCVANIHDRPNRSDRASILRIESRTIFVIAAWHSRNQKQILCYAALPARRDMSSLSRPAGEGSALEFCAGGDRRGLRHFVLELVTAAFT
jgi:hypothetical protein